LPEPFLVLATQNPMEMEGTYPLPEAQLDRFMFKIRVPFPDLDSLVEISRRTTGFTEPKLTAMASGKELIALQHELAQMPVADPVAHYASRLILATHPEQPDALPEVKRYVSYGSSPRGLQSLIRGARVWAAVTCTRGVCFRRCIRAACAVEAGRTPVRRVYNGTSSCA
jgi:MoxR-like ATPase